MSRDLTYMASLAYDNGIKSTYHKEDNHITINCSDIDFLWDLAKCLFVSGIGSRIEICDFSTISIRL